jgi:hemolysin III
MDEAPIRHGEEWANALTHGLAAVGALVAGGYMVTVAAADSRALAIACLAYAWSVFGTFLFSSLSHTIRTQPLLNTLRAWDQAMIYTMIVGTYTPITVVYAPANIRTPMIAAMWIAAAAGFLAKVAIRHRINAIGTISYLLLGWLPAIPLVTQVPTALAWAMALGGVIYTIGVVFLVNDDRFPYLHAVWHLLVILAAMCHFLGIMVYVVM